jgi:hypothetical protein
MGGGDVSLEAWGGRAVFVAPADDSPIGGREARDLLSEASVAGAGMVAIPAARLEPAFFDLRSGVAGDILQVSATYQMPLAIVGEVPEPAASSGAFSALVRESNAGSQHWFVGSLEELRGRLEGG